jgi:hypothetical protein
MKFQDRQKILPDRTPENRADSPKRFSVATSSRNRSGRVFVEFFATLLLSSLRDGLPINYQVFLFGPFQFFIIKKAENLSNRGDFIFYRLPDMRPSPSSAWSSKAAPGLIICTP